jgi:ABC-type Fe3+/spermidine/putrescine transport system ATPase subunit
MDAPAPPALELRAVTRRFGSVLAVDGASMSVGRGEVLALVGPSGCGKTTLLRLAAGLERADGGQVLLDGQVVDGPRGFTPPQRRGLGMVFQSYALWPHMSVGQNVGFPLSVRRVPAARSRERVAAMLALVGLDGLGERSAATLSGGQAQRVALARALVAEPAVLLLDEPFASLDTDLRAGLRDELRALQRRLGVSVLLVTHDREDALALADRVALMREGRIQRVGAPADLLA